MSEREPTLLAPATREVMEAMLEEVAVVARELRGYAEAYERDGEHQRAHWLYHRLDALADATSEATWHLVETMTPEQLDDALRRDGFDPERVRSEGAALFKRLCAEHRARAADEDIPFGQEEIDLRGCQAWSGDGEADHE